MDLTDGAIGVHKKKKKKKGNTALDEKHLKNIALLTWLDRETEIFLLKL